jgi:multidrug resistance efflux pump
MLTSPKSQYWVDVKIKEYKLKGSRQGKSAAIFTSRRDC